jgi:REP element-mobilizing transposase RayT
MAKNKTNFANRQTSRAKWHEYNGGEYFVTICTNNRIHYFGEIVDGAIQLTEIGAYLKTQIENIKTHYPYANVLLSTIMPNHIHMIVNIDYQKIPYDRSVRNATRTRHATSLHVNDDNKNEYMRNIANEQGWLSVCIGGIKSSLTRYAHERNISFGWQKRYHDHIIRNQLEMNRIAEYIINNPLIWFRDRNNPL